MAMLEQLGINQDPIQQLGGLVQLLNAMEQPDQWQAEMDYRNEGQMMQQDQFDRSAQMQQQGLNQRAGSEEQQARQWLEEMAFKKQLSTVEQQRFLDQQKQEKAQTDQAGLLGFLNQIPDLMALQIPVDPQALQPRMEAQGLGGFLKAPPPSTNSRAKTSEQAIQEASRQRVLNK